jgi:hypothetical protein
VRDVERDQRLQLRHETMRAIGRQVQAKPFDRDESILSRFVRPEDRA